MTLKLGPSPYDETEAHGFEVLSENAAGISCDEGVVKIPKSNFKHLAVDEEEYILMKFLEVERNMAEVPKTILLKAKRNATDVRISGQWENYIFDDQDAAYLDLLKRPSPLHQEE